MEHDKTWVLLCNHVVDRTRPIQLIIHEREDDWQALCGEYDHGGDDCVIYCAACAAEQFPAFAAHLTLEQGFLAEWVEGEWEVAAFDQ